MLNQYVSAYQIPSVYLNIEIIDPDYDPTSPYVRVFRLLNKSVRNELPKYNPSQDSSIDSISAWYQRGPGFKSQQG